MPQRVGDRGGKEVGATVDPYQRWQAADRPVGPVRPLIAGQRDPQSGQDRVPGGLVRRDRRTGHRVRRRVDEPRHPREHKLAVQQHLDRCMLVIRLPAGITPLFGAPQVDIVTPPRALPTRESRALPCIQIKADRPVQRRQRRHRIHLASLRGGRGVLAQQLPVQRGCVPAPRRQTSMQFVSDPKPLPRHRAHTPMTGGVQPPPHRPHRHPRRRRGQPHMLRGQLPAPIQRQQTRHSLLAPQHPGHHRRRRRAMGSAGIG